MGSTSRRFVFGRCLGRGSFGEVYAATMRSPGGLESPVAVKLLRADIDLDGEAVRRLRDEGRLLARLNHPAILKVFDLVTLRGRLALITELVEGADLADCIPRTKKGAEPKPRMPVRALVQSLSQIASALDAASTTDGPEGPLRLVHRDVKPSNIRIDRHGQAKLLDFGIARFDASDREVRTASDLVVGSVPYMAPERFIERGVEPSSDVFSVGCTLYEGIAGKRFYGSSNVAKISGLALQPEVYRTVTAERIAELNVAAGIKELLGALVHIEPERRPPASEVAARLEQLADAIGGPTLRMWCRDREWPRARGPVGALEGETLEEGDEPEAAPSGSGPVIHRSPLETIEPGQAAAALAKPPPAAANLTLVPEKPVGPDSLLEPPSAPAEPDGSTEPETRPPAESTTALPARISETEPLESGGGVGFALVSLGAFVVGLLLVSVGLMVVLAAMFWFVAG